MLVHATFETKAIRTARSLFRIPNITAPLTKKKGVVVKVYSYNPGQNCLDINATASENDAFSPPPVPPGSVLTLWLQIFLNTNNMAEGRGTAETGSFNNISKHL